MTNAEWVDLLNLIPESQHSQLVIMLSSGSELGIETILRLDQSYVVFRGRALGSTEEGRVFFVPLSQIVFLNLNRYVREDEIHKLFDVEAPPASAAALPPAASLPPPPTGSGTVPRLNPLPPIPRPAPVEVPTNGPRPTPALPYVPPAPTAAAKSSILERLRAQRGPRPK